VAHFSHNDDEAADVLAQPTYPTRTPRGAYHTVTGNCIAQELGQAWILARSITPLAWQNRLIRQFTPLPFGQVHTTDGIARSSPTNTVRCAHLV
jgi:hypothetical protein